jgi:transcription elongation factor GreA
MEARIRQLQTMLVTARVIDRQAGGDVVEAGSVVAIRYAGDDATERYLVGSIEERRDGLEVISPASPLGQALLGRRAGERVTYEAVGRTLDVEIVTVGD